MMDDILCFHANRSDAHQSSILNIVLIDNIVTTGRGARKPIIRHETTLPLSLRSLEDPSTAHCQDTRRKFHLVRRQKFGEAQFHDFQRRDLLHAGRAGCLYGLALLNLGLQAAAKLPAALRKSCCRGRL
jgi:hypothetical protein